jgi:3-hydroxyacyl-CoA dehydrogenase
VLATVMKLAKKIKKVAVVSGVCDGFIGNRMLEQYIRQSLFLLDEGASPAAGRQGADEVRHGDGPVRDGRHGRQRHRLGDPQAPLRREAAPDVQQASADRWSSWAATARRPARAGTTTSRQAARRSRPGGRCADRDYRKEIGITPRAIDDDEIVQRCIYALVNEGAKHPRGGHRPARQRHRHRLPHRLRLPGVLRGGPMFHAQAVGLERVVGPRSTPPSGSPPTGSPRTRARAT